jgi:hypothetical protein
MPWNCSRHSCEGVNGQIAEVNAVAWTCNSRLSLMGFRASAERDTRCMIYTWLSNDPTMFGFMTYSNGPRNNQKWGRWVCTCREGETQARQAIQTRQTRRSPGAGKFSGRS